jgi:hypothetical protein
LRRRLEGKGKYRLPATPVKRAVAGPAGGGLFRQQFPHQGGSADEQAEQRQRIPNPKPKMPRMVQRSDGQGKMVNSAFGHFLRYDFHTRPE